MSLTPGIDRFTCWPPPVKDEISAILTSWGLV